jgi:hypothetical protein
MLHLLHSVLARMGCCKCWHVHMHTSFWSQCKPSAYKQALLIKVELITREKVHLNDLSRKQPRQCIMHLPIDLLIHLNGHIG